MKELTLQLLCILRGLVAASLVKIRYRSREVQNLHFFMVCFTLLFCFAEFATIKLNKVTILIDPRLSIVRIGLTIFLLAGRIAPLPIYIGIACGTGQHSWWIVITSLVLPYIMEAVIYVHDKLQTVRANPMQKPEYTAYADVN